MKKITLFLILAASIYCGTLFSQESIMFDKQYLFDNQGSYIRDVKQTSDSGYICAGGIGFSMYDERYLLFKTDSLGELQWYKYNNTSAIHSNLWAVGVTDEGNYIGIGTTMDNPDWHESGAIVMYNSNGDTLWTKQYAFNYPDDENSKYKINFYTGLYSGDNSIIAGGTIANYNSDYCDPLIVKTNITGDTLWTWRIFKGDDQIVINSIVETKEGDYIAVGKADKPILEDTIYTNCYAPQRGFIVKLNSNGELIYLKEWTDIEFNYFTDVAINSNNELIISGVYFQHPPEYPDDECFGFILKTDNLGETIFYDIIGYGTGLEGLCSNVSSSNEIIFVGMYAIPLSLDWNHDVLIRKYSDMGVVLWSKNIGEKEVINWPYALISTNDNGIAFCGLYFSNTGNYSWLVKTDSMGDGVYGEGWINSIPENFLNDQIQVYPNPADQNLNIRVLGVEKNFTATILSLDGREVKYLENNCNSVFVGDLSNGFYILKINYNNQTYTQKIIVKH